jgi:ABC-type phosphate transport system substrate-binding protein
VNVTGLSRSLPRVLGTANKFTSMTMTLTRTALIAASFALGASTVWAQDVTGAGATFPAPIYAKWADAYNKATGPRQDR